MQNGTMARISGTTAPTVVQRWMVMRMREKLIEMLGDIQLRGEAYTYYEIYGMRLHDTVSNEEVADHLIANGVTIPVRCKDCKHYEKTTLGNGDRCMCNKFLGLTIPKPDDFCSYGERRSDA